MNRLSFSLPVPPSVNQCYTNVAGVGRVSTKKYRAWKRVALPYCLTVKRGIVTPPYRLTISVPADMRGDIANREKPLSDLLVKARVLPDDRHAERVTTERGAHKDGMAICRIEWGAE